MRVPFNDDFVDPDCPINWSHPLNNGLAAEYSVLPNAGWSRGPQLLAISRGGPAPPTPGTFNGTLMSLPTWVARPRTGGFGGLNFNASDSFIELAAIDKCLPTADRATIALWSRKTDTTNRVSATIGMSAWTSSTTVGCHLPYSNGVVYFDWGGQSDGSTRLSVSGLTFDTDWHHWVFTVGSGLGMRLYRDGILVGSNAATPSRSTGSANLRINQMHPGAGVGGDLIDFDGLQTYGRTLMPGEVWALYQEGLAGNPERWNWVRRIRWFSVAIETSTGVGTGALSATAATTAGSGTHAAPVYSGSGAVSTVSTTSAGSGTYAAPVYSGTGSLAGSATTSAGSGTHTAPVYSGSGAVSTTTATTAGSGTHAAPVYAGTSSLAGSETLTAGSGTHAVPVYTGSASIVVEAGSVAASGSHTAPVYTGSASIVVEAGSVAASGTQTPPAYAGVGAAITSAVTVTGAGSVGPPVYSGTGSPATQEAMASGSGVHAAPVYSGTGTLLVEVTGSAGSGVHVAPAYDGSGSIDMSAVVTVGDGSAGSESSYSGSGSLTVLSVVATVVAGYIRIVPFTGVGGSIARRPYVSH